MTLDFDKFVRDNKYEGKRHVRKKQLWYLALLIVMILIIVFAFPGFPYA